MGRGFEGLSLYVEIREKNVKARSEKDMDTVLR